ncbi:MAG TPA: hypothetical protein VJ829_06015, partial [Candidatus Binatia bacterium]|nr:hypothetical protein [Candidatus Binatia bacterium]
MAAGRLSRCILLSAAALAIVVRAPVYVTGPSFWAEEGSLYFAVAWDHPLREALIYRPAGCCGTSGGQAARRRRAPT